MKHYAHYGFKEFFIALGYRGRSDQAFLHGLSAPQRQHEYQFRERSVDTQDEAKTGSYI